MMTSQVFVMLVFLVVQVDHCYASSIPLLISSIQKNLRLNGIVIVLPSNLSFEAADILDDGHWNQINFTLTILSWDVIRNLPNTTSNSATFMIMNGSGDHTIDILNRKDHIFARHRHVKYCLLYPSSYLQDSELLQIFQWFWTQNMLNVLVVFRSQHTKLLLKYTYIPFGTFRLLPIYDSDFFPDKLLNVEGYKISFDFGGKFLRGGKCFRLYFSRDFQLIKLFAGALNAAAIPTILSRNRNRTEFLVTRITSVSEHQLVGEFKNQLYPMIMEKMCIIVPNSAPIPQFLNYFIAFHKEVWVICLTSILAMLFSLHYIRRRRGRLFNEILHLIQLLANAPAFVDYSRLVRKEMLLIVPWTFAGIIVANMYLSTLTSLATHPLRIPEIETIEGIASAGLRIAVRRTGDADLSVIRRSPFFENIKDLTDVLEPMDYYDRIFAINGSSCYLCTAIMWDIINKRQRQLGRQTFHIIREYFKFSFISFTVPEDSVFRDKFNNLMFWAFGSGLYFKWFDNTYAELLQNGCLAQETVHHDSLEPESLKFSDLQGAWYLLVLGIVISMLSFVVEWLLYIYRSKQRSLTVMF